ncbi:MAG: hypothetical protein E7655_02120 [Ruminococcaceae bacterium]|nr:hypothetical protein [Oscillospiraceae bacterium]
MRVIKNYCFKIGTKIPFSEWPSIVQRFLSDNHLTDHRFLYYFEDSVRDAASESRYGCERILKDCPSLGDIRYYYKDSNGQMDRWLSNIDRQESFPKEKLLPLMKKIYRSYGFFESRLLYFDIDFFGKKTHFERDFSRAKQEAERKQTPLDPTFQIKHQPYGSGITLYRDCCGGSSSSYMVLSVDLLHEGQVLDATPYYESMQALLPDIKTITSLNVYFSEEELREIEAVNRAAEPTIEKCRAFFEDRLPDTRKQNNFPSKYSVAKPLKKLAVRYGYAYKLIWNGGVYALEKRTARGNVMHLAFDSGPSHYDVDVILSFQGIGFYHRLGISGQTPTNQSETDAYFEKVMSIVSDFEKTMLPDLDGLFPESPNWFIPKV